MSDLLDETGAAKSMSYDFTTAKLTTTDEVCTPYTMYAHNRLQIDFTGITFSSLAIFANHNV